MSRDYWAERDADAQNRITDKGIEKTNAQMRKYYKSAMDRVIRDFEATLDKLNAAAAEGMQPTPADLYKLDKYWQMQGQLQRELTALGDRTARIMSRNFTKQYENIYNSISLPSTPVYGSIDTAMANQMINKVWCADGKNWSQRVWDNTSRLQQTLNDQLLHCVVTGKTTRELKQLLQQEFGVSYNQAKTIVVTEMAHLQTQAAQDRYKEYGVEEVEVLIEKDEKLCDICADFEGKTFPIHGAMPVPAHPNCRCCIVPIIKGGNSNVTD